jgi:hypothetical protein
MKMLLEAEFACISARKGCSEMIAQKWRVLANQLL